VGFGGLCPPQLGVWGLPPQKKKKKICAKNYAILSKFWYFFPKLQQKVGDYPPSPESGGPIPCPPCSDAYGQAITFPILHQTASWMSDYLAVKPSAIGQPTWPTQPSIPQGSVNE